MNRKLNLALVVVLTSISMDRGHAQGGLPEPVIRGLPTGLTGGIVLAGNRASSVTVSRNGAPLASLTLPVGTLLSVTYDNRKPTLIAQGRWTFQGDFVLRAIPVSELPGTGNTPDGAGCEPSTARDDGAERGRDHRKPAVGPQKGLCKPV